MLFSAFKETPVNPPGMMKCKTGEAQETKHIITISEFLSVGQRSESLAQSIIQRFPCFS